MLLLAKNKHRFRFLELETFRLSHCKVPVYLELIKENTAHAMRSWNSYTAYSAAPAPAHAHGVCTQYCSCAQGAITQLYSILQFSLRSEGLAEL